MTDPDPDLDGGAISEDDVQPRSSGTRRPPKPVKHQWFDQWLIARGEPLKRLIAEVGQIIENREQRQRARKPADRMNHTRMVEGIVCNLSLRHPQAAAAIRQTSGEHTQRGQGQD